MRVHLLYSEEIGLERYDSLLDLLQTIKGTIQFVKQRDQGVELRAEGLGFMERKGSKKRHDFHSSTDLPSVSWETLFNVCRIFRQQNDIGENEFVVLLTDYANKLNWFSAPDLSGARNMFVQTSGWGVFAHGEWRYPVVYQIVTNLLRHFMARNLEEMEDIIHLESIGCMNDFNRDKRGIQYKLRTADICSACAQRINVHVSDKNIVRQVIAYMDLVRTHMLFRSRFTFTKQPSSLCISRNGQEIKFTDLGDTLFELAPLNRAVFLFFLNHPEGVVLNDLVDHQVELRRIYQNLNPNKDQEAVRTTIENLVQPGTGGITESLTRIKRAFVLAVGADIAEYYYISGRRNEPYRIGLDREWVHWE